MTTRISLTTTDGITLDARIDGPEPPELMVVWCHPHPLYGGSMFAPLMNAVTDGLTAAGLSVLRFDFRGVGESGGVHGGGISEMDDVAAAVDAAGEYASELILAGWSFGADTALRYLAREHSALPFLGVAPPLIDPPAPAALSDAHVTLLVGSRDQVVKTEAVEAYGNAIGARIVVVDGADHFFTLRHRPIVEAIVELSGRPV